MLIKTLLANIVEFISDIVIITKADINKSPDPEIIYVNPAFTALTGFTTVDAIGQTPAILYGAKTKSQTTSQIRDAYATKKQIEATLLVYGRENNEILLELKVIPLSDNSKEITHFALIASDITQRRHDQLTNVANQYYFMDRTKREFERFKRTLNPLSLIYIDIDNFNQVGAMHGHQIADQVLVQFAQLCLARVREIDVFARISSDNFALLLPETNMLGAVNLAHNLRELVNKHEFVFDDTVIKITASFGVTEFLERYLNVRDAIRNCEDALFASKKNGGNVVNSYQAPA